MGGEEILGGKEGDGELAFRGNSVSLFSMGLVLISSQEVITLYHYEDGSPCQAWQGGSCLEMHPSATVLCLSGFLLLFCPMSWSLLCFFLCLLSVFYIQLSYAVH